MIVLFSVFGILMNGVFYVVGFDPKSRYLMPCTVMLFTVYFIVTSGEKTAWKRVLTVALILCLMIESLNVYYVSY